MDGAAAVVADAVVAGHAARFREARAPATGAAAGGGAARARIRAGRIVVLAEVIMPAARGGGLAAVARVA